MEHRSKGFRGRSGRGEWKEMDIEEGEKAGGREENKEPGARIKNKRR